MLKRISKKTAVGLERLEVRETPTAGALGVSALSTVPPALHPPHMTVLSFRGTETVNFGAPVAGSNTGQIVLNGTGTGTATGLGSFKVKLTDTIAADVRSFSATETLTNGSGDQVYFQINGYYKLKINNSGGQAMIVGQEGAGVFADSITLGHAIVTPITTTVYPDSQVTITFHGRVIRHTSPSTSAGGFVTLP